MRVFGDFSNILVAFIMEKERLCQFNSKKGSKRNGSYENKQ